MPSPRAAGTSIVERKACAKPREEAYCLCGREDLPGKEDVTMTEFEREMARVFGEPAAEEAPPAEEPTEPTEPTEEERPYCGAW